MVVEVQAVDLRTDILQPDQIRFPLELGQLVNRTQAREHSNLHLAKAANTKFTSKKLSLETF